MRQTKLPDDQTDRKALRRLARILMMNIQTLHSLEKAEAQIYTSDYERSSQRSLEFHRKLPDDQTDKKALRRSARSLKCIESDVCCSCATPTVSLLNQVQKKE